MFSAHEILDLAIQIEENGERFYREAAEISFEPSFKELLQWLAEEELGHSERFLTMRASISREIDDLWVEQISGAILQNSLGERVFALEEVDFSSIQDQDAIIQKAIDFEHDSITFYEILRSFISDVEVLGQIDTIIQEEQKHIELLREKRKLLE